MLFTSYEFLGFMVLLLIVYYLIPRKYQWPLLLAFSYWFYFLADFRFLFYILVTTATVYLTAVAIEKNREKEGDYLKEHKEEMSREERKSYKSRQRRICCQWLIICLLLNLGILAVVKYGNFFISNVNSIIFAFGKGSRLSFMTLVMPLGISFYTFQAIGYLIDVYQETVKAEKNPFKLALFISFFPQLMQGPISRFEDLTRTLYGEHKFNIKAVSRGLQRILWGYFKKLVVADRILAAVSTITGNTEIYNGAYIFVGMLFYTVELYADFTGGIDITIGIAETLGIVVQENFNRPYFSKSLKEYWRRWHISMCAWFRSYVFYPVSASRALRKFSGFSRKHFGERVGKRLPVYAASFAVWLATGIWHGASWNFVVWGLANWLVLMVSEELEPYYDKFHERYPVIGQKKIYKLFQVGRTFLLVCCLNLFDCYSSVADTLCMAGSMFTAGNWNILWNGSLLDIGLTTVDYGVLAFGTILMIIVSLIQRGGSVREKSAVCPYAVKFIIWYGLFLLVLLTGIYGIGYDASQFIYNQF